MEDDKAPHSEVKSGFVQLTKKLEPYQTILAVIFCSVILSLFSHGKSYPYGFLNILLGYILIFSSMMKLAHLLYFAQHFLKRSFISPYWPFYAYVFPFVQLFFGAVLVNGTYVFFVSFLVLVIMGELVLSSTSALFLNQVHEEGDLEMEEDTSFTKQPQDVLMPSDPFLWPSVVLCESAFAVIMAVVNIAHAIRNW